MATEEAAPGMFTSSSHVNGRQLTSGNRLLPLQPWHVSHYYGWPCWREATDKQYSLTKYRTAATISQKVLETVSGPTSNHPRLLAW